MRCRGGVLVVVGATAALAASPGAMAQETLEQFKARVFKPEYLARGLGMVPTVSAAASGVLPPRPLHRRCEVPGTCNVLVGWTYPANPAEIQPDCGVVVPSVLMTKESTSQIQWVLNPAPAAVDPLMRFKVGSAGADWGIVFTDNSDDPNESDTIDGGAVPSFSTDPPSVDRRRFHLHVSERGQMRRKLYYYGITLEYWHAAENRYKECRHYDPVIVNRGD